MNERIKKLRKALDLTQQEFAERIGSVQNTITGYETGRRIPSGQVVSLICKEFNVNEVWLRTGEGEIFVDQSQEEEIATHVKKMLSGETSNFKKRLISVLSRLDESDWAVLENKLREIVGERDIEILETKRSFPTPIKPEPSIITEAEINKEVEAYRQELIAEAKGAEKLSALHNEKDA